MSEVYYPSRGELRTWINFVEHESTNTDWKRSLPVVSDDWYDSIVDIINLLRIGIYPQELHHIAAVLFYKIIKLHKYIDSNKRSALIVVYLFYILNDHILLPTEDLKNLAKKIARSKGRKRQIYWENKIEKFFSESVIKL